MHAPAHKPPRAPSFEPPKNARAEPVRHRFDVESLMALADAGLLQGRVDLIDGELFDMPPQGNPHAVGVTYCVQRLMMVWPAPKFVRIQATHRFSPIDAPEPDVALLDSEPIADAIVDELPRLVVEVSVSTLNEDLGRKKLFYARFGVPEYWVLDAYGRQLFVFREPNPKAVGASEAWRDERVLGPGDAIAPLCIPDSAIHVTSLLPTVSGPGPA